MSDERLLALVLGGMGVVAGGAALMSRSPEAPTIWYEVHWPRSVEEKDVVAFLRSLAGDRSAHVVALELVGSKASTAYRLGLRPLSAGPITTALRSFVPGVELTIIKHSNVSAPTFAWEVRMNTRQRPARLDNAEQVARAVITTLSTVRDDEVALIQWLLGPRLAPLPVGRHAARATESWTDTVKFLARGAVPLDADERRTLQSKVGEPGFRIIGRMGVAGATERSAQAVAGRLLAALRMAEAPGVSFSLRRTGLDAIALAQPSRDWPLALNVKELAAVAALPLGDLAYPGVRGDGPIKLRASGSEGKGRVVGASTHPGEQRDLVLSPTDALQHLHVLGPTGVGKSTLLLNLIEQDIVAGRGVVVVDPKGDLVEDVLARVPLQRRGDVVVLDPADESQPVGLNVLHAAGRSPELIADQVLAVFHGLYQENWGPRTQDILHASLLTLAGKEGMTLCALPVLLSNERFRRSAVKALTDEIALKPFWHWFDSISDGERQQAIAPVMNKLRAFVLRPRMRAIIGQSQPRFDLSRVFDDNKILLVSLAKGLLGPEAAALLGSLVVSQLWQAALGRVRLPASKRSPVMAYVDEFQDYLHLPTDLADVLAQARGLGVGLTLAHQHLGQLPTAMRSAVLSNARSRVCFQLAADDARTIASMAPELQPQDLQRQPRFEAYASLVSSGSVMPFASLRTLAPSEPVVDSADVRALSRERYGRPIGEIEAELAKLVNGGDGGDDGPLGRRRRS